MRPRLASPLLAGCFTVLVAVGAVGCTPDPPDPAHSSTPSVTAPFTTDEEALSAARAAYEKYNSVADQILQDGGEEPERVRELAAGSALRDVMDAAKVYRDQRVRLVGTSSIDTVKLQRYDAASKEITLYACQDVSRTDVQTKDGMSTVLPSRRNRIPRQVELVYQMGHIVVSGDRLWTGSDFCV